MCQLVWYYWIAENITNTKCCCCKINTIITFDFEIENMKTNLEDVKTGDNLVSICKRCKNIF